VHLLEVHHVDRWLLDLPFGKLTQALWKKGFAFDYVSDLQLTRLKLDKNGNLTAGNAVYKTLVIPVSTYMPEATLLELKRLAAGGAKIIFEKNIPSKVTGFEKNTENQNQFAKDLAALQKINTVKVSENVNQDLIAFGAAPETFAENGLTFIRKKTPEGKPLYFISNLSNTFTEGWITLGRKGAFETMNPVAETAQWHKLPQKGSQIYVKLLPGQSCFLRETNVGEALTSSLVAEKQVELKGNWKLTFLKGKPSIPGPAEMKDLKTWTSLPDSAVYFSGTARYELHFDCPEALVKSNVKIIDLGDVREVAAVKLNGKTIGTAWSIPFQLHIKEQLKAKDNVLEIEVTNLSANYMRLRDTQQPDWKKFHDINIVDITYKKFDATKWEPMPSGLLGPVKILYK
jgi:hypothetical protein